MARDIDYAVLAVHKAVVEKFKGLDLKAMETIAGENLITIRHDGRIARGTRDELLSLLNKVSTYEEFWTLLTSAQRHRV